MNLRTLDEQGLATSLIGVFMYVLKIRELRKKVS